MSFPGNNVNNKSLVWIAVTGVALLMAGCASPGTPSKQEQPATVPVATPAAVAPATPVSGNMGRVVFFRESKFAGGAVSFKVREGEQELGKLSSGTYFVADVPTGPHTYTVHSEAKDVLNLEVERGETYYVRGSISMGVLVGRPNLAPSDAATFDTLKPKLKDSVAPKK